MSTPDILQRATRQYRHNTDMVPGFVVGFDYDETCKIVRELEKRIADLRQEVLDISESVAFGVANTVKALQQRIAELEQSINHPSQAQETAQEQRS